MDIQDQCLESAVSQQLQAIGRGRPGRHLDAECTKILAHHRGQALVIVDHQNTFGHLPARSGEPHPIPLP